MLYQQGALLPEVRQGKTMRMDGLAFRPGRSDICQADGHKAVREVDGVGYCWPCWMERETAGVVAD